MDDDDPEQRRYPTWVRVVLVGLQAVGVVAGVVLGVLTYDAWSQPHDPAPPSTTVVTPETEVPSDTLG